MSITNNEEWLATYMILIYPTACVCWPQELEQANPTATLHEQDDVVYVGDRYGLQRVVSAALTHVLPHLDICVLPHS